MGGMPTYRRTDKGPHPGLYITDIRKVILSSQAKASANGSQDDLGRMFILLNTSGTLTKYTAHFLCNALPGPEIGLAVRGVWTDKA